MGYLAQCGSPATTPTCAARWSTARRWARSRSRSSSVERFSDLTPEEIEERVRQLPRDDRLRACRAGRRSRCLTSGLVTTATPASTSTPRTGPRAASPSCCARTRTAGHALRARRASAGCSACRPVSSSPVLVASADGVGTKLKVAFMAGRHDTVGRGPGQPLRQRHPGAGRAAALLPRLHRHGQAGRASSRSSWRAWRAGCRENGCALLGGETAEMPDFYAPGEYDLAGTIVGVVEEDGMLDGARIAAGDVLVGAGARPDCTPTATRSRAGSSSSGWGSAWTIRSPRRTAPP